jgi:hypothetical protein
MGNLIQLLDSAEDYFLTREIKAQPEVYRLIIPPVVHQIEPLDIEIPGQPFSLLVAVRYLKLILGIEEDTINITITEDKDSYSADIDVISKHLGHSYATVTSVITDGRTSWSEK